MIAALSYGEPSTWQEVVMEFRVTETALLYLSKALTLAQVKNPLPGPFEKPVTSLRMVRLVVTLYSGNCTSRLWLLEVL
jgi:hypothetical protein